MIQQPRPIYSPDGRRYWDGAAWQPVSPVALAPATSYVSAGPWATGAVVTSGMMILACVAYICVWLFAGPIGGIAYVLIAAAAVATAVAVVGWTYRAHRNLAALGARDLRWSPAWAIGAWLIPAANLVLPYLVVRETWRATRPEGRSSPLVWSWWACWLLAPATCLAAIVVASVPPAPVRSMASIIAFVAVGTAALAGGLLALLALELARLQDVRAAAPGSRPGA